MFWFDAWQRAKELHVLKHLGKLNLPIFIPVSQLLEIPIKGQQKYYFWNSESSVLQNNSI